MVVAERSGLEVSIYICGDNTRSQERGLKWKREERGSSAGVYATTNIGGGGSHGNSNLNI